MNRIRAYCFQTCLAALMLIISACEWGGSAKKMPVPEVPVTKVSTSNVPVIKQYIGITQSVSSIDIKARVEGFLTKMNFVEGKPVKKGQLLFMIDTQPFEASLTMAQGELSRSIAAKQYQQIEYLRMKDLVAKGDVSKSYFDQVSSRFTEASAAVESNTAKVDQARINLSYCSMYSPIDGVISHKYVDVGNLVGGVENTLLANVVQLNPIYVQFSPSVSDYAQFLKYSENMPFEVTVNFPENEQMIFHGKVDLVNNQADVPTSTILMRASIENPKGLLLPGIYVNVALKLTDKNSAILVPMKAVIEMQGQRSVYVVGKDNKVESRLINVSGQQGQDYVVASGLQNGDLIVVNGVQKIRPGAEVTPIIAKN